MIVPIAFFKKQEEVVSGPITMLIDFGRDLHTYNTVDTPWNNFNTTVGLVVGSRLDNLITDENKPTSINIEVTQDFSNYVANVKYDDTNTEIPYPFTACRDGFQIDAGLTSGLKISGLSQDKTYKLEIYSSRGYTGGLTEYTVEGVMKTLMTKDNVSNTVIWDNVNCNISNEINIIVNGETGKFGVISVLALTEI